MKIRSRHLNKVLSALVVTSLLGSVAINAADAPQPNPQPNRGAAGARGGFRGVMLDDKQREVLQEAAQNHRDEMRKLAEQLRDAQRELTKAMLAENPDEKVIREKAEAVAKIQVEETMIRAKIVAAVAPTLKPDQREQMMDNPFMLNMLTGGMGGMGGMRGAMGNRPNAGPGGGRGGRQNRGQ